MRGALELKPLVWVPEQLPPQMYNTNRGRVLDCVFSLVMHKAYDKPVESMLRTPTPCAHLSGSLRTCVSTQFLSE